MKHPDNCTLVLSKGKGRDYACEMQECFKHCAATLKKNSTPQLHVMRSGSGVYIGTIATNDEPVCRMSDYLDPNCPSCTGLLMLGPVEDRVAAEMLITNLCAVCQLKVFGVDNVVGVCAKCLTDLDREAVEESMTYDDESIICKDCAQIAEGKRLADDSEAEWIKDKPEPCKICRDVFGCGWEFRHNECDGEGSTTDDVTGNDSDT